MDIDLPNPRSPSIPPSAEFMQSEAKCSGFTQDLRHLTLRLRLS